MDVSYVLRRAWTITWQRRTLWLFGLLVSLGTVSTRLGMTSIQWEAAVEGLPPEIQDPILEFLSSPYLTVTAVGFTLLGFAVSVGLSLLGTLGRVGLVHQTRAAEEYGVVVLKGGWLAGKRHLWQVFFIRLLLVLPIAVLIFVGVLPAAVTRLLAAWQEQPEVVLLGAIAALLLVLICLTPILCLAVLLSIPIGVMQRLAVRACVLEGCDVCGSLARAWEMLRQHLGWLALVWLILVIIGAGVLLLIGLPLVLARLVAVAILGVAETFASTAWTLAYRDLTGMGRTGGRGSSSMIAFAST